MKILVQTTPQPGYRPGMTIKAHYIKDENNPILLFEYTLVMGTTDGFAPYGITYAIFGSQIGDNNAATYKFNDGMYIHIQNVHAFLSICLA